MRVWALQYGDTALIMASHNGHVEAMALLLDRGADLEAKNRVRAAAMCDAAQQAASGVTGGRVGR